MSEFVPEAAIGVEGNQPWLSKVPEVTAIFWVIKILTTGMGETTSDFFAHRIDPPIVVAVAGVCLLISLAVQFFMPRFNAWTYWVAVVMVSVFGTMAADALHVGLGIPYWVSTAFFGASLLVIFAVWYWSERTLSIHSIYTKRREFFYWATVLTTFALGTAAGDLTATSLGLGYFVSGLIFLALIVVPAIAYWNFRLPEIPAFWFAYIVTRPLGASFADWMGVSHERGGLDWGTGPVSLVLAILICVFVAYSALSARAPSPVAAGSSSA